MCVCVCVVGAVFIKHLVVTVSHLNSAIQIHSTPHAALKDLVTALLSSSLTSSPPPSLLNSPFVSSPLLSSPSLTADYRYVIPCIWQAGWLAKVCVCVCVFTQSVFTHLCGQLCTCRCGCEQSSSPLILIAAAVSAGALLEDSKGEWTEAIVLRKATSETGGMTSKLLSLGFSQTRYQTGVWLRTPAGRRAKNRQALWQLLQKTCK